MDSVSDRDIRALMKPPFIERVEMAVPYLTEAVCRLIYAYSQERVNMCPSEEEFEAEEGFYLDYRDDSAYQLSAYGDEKAPKRFLQSHPREYFQLLGEVMECSADICPNPPPSPPFQ
uniref:Uncharacterized protein n=1 Tax=Lotharella oceanica TaxID=641309 RepID=A0A7S2XF11_9EUKA|mmetsp:Transcript_35345/g.65482  ORF Transcript_35345/g.65482 Transcript_35345/m.65482 type:complete len:117 (+) Transcript_35345:51-401(+)